MFQNCIKTYDEPYFTLHNSFLSTAAIISKYQLDAGTYHWGNIPSKPIFQQIPWFLCPSTLVKNRQTSDAALPLHRVSCLYSPFVFARQQHYKLDSFGWNALRQLRGLVFPGKDESSHLRQIFRKRVTGY